MFNNDNTLAIIERLLAAGADHQIKDAQGNTPLDLARKFGIAEVVKCLEPDVNGVPAYLSQLKNSPCTLDESIQVMGIKLPPELNDMIMKFTFFEPSKTVREKLTMLAEPAIDEKISSNHNARSSSNL